MNWGNLLRADIVANTPSLTNLSLSVYTVTMEMATALARNSTITELRLMDCSIPDDVVPTLMAKPNLHSLYVLSSYHSQSPNYLRGLRFATSLRSIELSANAAEARAAIGRELIDCLIRCSTLDTLSIPSFSVGADGVQQLTLHMPVKDLRLRDEALGATGLMHVRNNSTLRALTLHSGTLGGIEGMKYLGDNASIRSLVLSSVKDLTTEGLAELLRRNTTLTSLNVSPCVPLEQDACRALAAHHSLRSVLLDVYDCAPVLEALAHCSPPELTKLTITARRWGTLASPELLTSLRVANLAVLAPASPPPLEAVKYLLKSPQLTCLRIRCDDGESLTQFTQLTPLRLDFAGSDYYAGLSFGNLLQRKTRNDYVTRLVYVAMARLRAWARGTAGASLLMQTPMEVFTHILSSADIFEIGLPRWTLAAIVRFLFQNRAEAERRLSNHFDMKMKLSTSVSCVDFIEVSWAMPPYELEADKRRRHEAEARRRAEQMRAKPSAPSEHEPSARSRVPPSARKGGLRNLLLGAK